MLESQIIRIKSVGVLAAAATKVQGRDQGKLQTTKGEKNNVENGYG